MESTIQFKVFICLGIIMKVCGAGIKIIDKNTNNVMCSEISKSVLSETLGSAFNSRYMSITPPKDPRPEEGKFKRRSDDLPSFYVEETFAEELNNTPSWPWDKEINRRRKRSAKPNNNYQWRCDSKLHWIDLGEDYFPRYLRSVECLTKNCWYGMFKCRPRSFTVKLLRKKKDRCIVARTGGSLGLEGLPVDLKEQWIWEEHAVNFCCDCAV